MSHIYNTLVSTRDLCLNRTVTTVRISITNIFHCLDETNKQDKADYQAYTNDMIEQLEDFINDGKINIMNVSELTKNMRSSCGPVKTSVARAISGFKIDIAAIEASLNESTRASSESLKAIEDALLLLQNRCNRR